MINALQAQFALAIEQLTQLRSQTYPFLQLHRVEVSLPHVHLHGFLSAQTHCLEKLYWRDREGELSAAGFAQVWAMSLAAPLQLAQVFAAGQTILKNASLITEALSAAESIITLADARCYCYLSFAESERTVWPAFGYGKIVIPLLEMVQRRRGTMLGINLYAKSTEQWQQQIDQAITLLQGFVMELGFPAQDFSYTTTAYQPDLPTWLSIIERAKQQFQQQSLDKVVLSREVAVVLQGRFSEWPLLHAWQQANPHSYQFLWQNPQETFFGCSPERLLKRLDRVIATEALAGTISRGSSDDEDALLANELSHDRKSIYENQLVLDDICRRLAAFCQHVTTAPHPSIVKLKNVQHLRYEIGGILNDGVEDAALLNTLHPTPAIGGTPKDAAAQFIVNHEGYHRGLYAGVCGMFDAHNSDFCVSIRSIRRIENTLLLYSGAGIVDASVAETEWEELNNKIKTIFDILTQQASTA